MPRKTSERRPQAPKSRNWIAKTVRDLNGPYRPRSDKDRSKYSRKKKHPKEVDICKE